MLIKARHRNAREKIKFLKLVAFDDVIGFSRVNHGFYLVRIGDDIQQKCCSRTYKHDPIVMTPLSLPSLFCSTFDIPSS